MIPSQTDRASIHPATTPAHAALRWAATLTGTRVLTALVILVAMALLAAMGEVINRDGTLFVRTAEAFLDGGLDAALELYPWPAYSVLFALVSRFTGLALEDAAHLVNAGLWVLLADAFIRLHARLEPDTGKPWVAALVFLSFPKLAHGLEIYRDWGYIAFALFAIVPLCRFWQEERGRVGDALLWQAGATMATLFRVEGAVLLALAPLALLLQDRPWRERLRRASLVGACAVPALVAVLAFVLASDTPVGRLHELLVYGNPAEVFTAFDEVARQIGDVLDKYSRDFAHPMLASGIVTMSVWMALKNLGVFLVLLTAYGLHRFGLPRRAGYGLIYSLLGIVALTLIVFFAKQLTLVGRYAVLASCLILIITSALAARLLDRRRTAGRRGRWVRTLALAGLVIGGLINTISVQPDYKIYIRDAGQWLGRNVPADVPIATNDTVINYYAGRPLGAQFSNLDQLRAHLAHAMPPYYVALRLDDHEAGAARALFSGAPVMEYHSPQARETLLIFYLQQR
ncbi:hypothetical protein [Thauera sinica]|uniref:Glycosyltransferase RgtA/B/C/D-like domain-containing protein n=1 Tax=Thauera sinica TaxID=2665146 RepID=A0ABW1APP6_9RHOO|nr:hypothetical protein [Thauera sp. K11]ATE62296.1 hypothetical protein CCZ27_21990 [Thauera sp. K11]